MRSRRKVGTIRGVTPEPSPPPIAYAIPTSDRSDVRVRRALAIAAMALGGVGDASSLFRLALTTGVVASFLYANAIQSGAHLIYESASALFDLVLLVGAALLLRADTRAARTLIRVGCGGRVVAVLAVNAVAMASYPASFTLGDRVYLTASGGLSLLVAHAAIFTLTFALPPRRAA